MSIQSSSTVKTFVFTSVSDGVDELVGSQVCERLSQLGVAPHRIIRVPDKSYLQRALSGERASYWMPGGSTMAMGNNLEPLSGLFKQAIRSGSHLFASCAGGNLVCEQIHLQDPRLGPKPRDVTEDFKIWKLLPVKAHTPYFLDQQKYKNNAPGKLIPITLPGGEEIVCYWNAGSKFDFDSSDITVEARYTDAVAAFSGSYGKGKIVALGFHPEIDVNAILARYSPDQLATDSHLVDLTQKKQSAEDSALARQDFLIGLLKKVEIL